MEVTCPTTDDFMSFVPWTCRIPDATLGHISVSDEIY